MSVNDMSYQLNDLRYSYSRGFTIDTHIVQAILFSDQVSRIITRKWMGTQYSGLQNLVELKGC